MIGSHIAQVYNHKTSQGSVTGQHTDPGQCHPGHEQQCYRLYQLPGFTVRLSLLYSCLSDPFRSANENTVNAGKKTVTPADVFKALEDTEFSFLRAPLEAEFASMPHGSFSRDICKMQNFTPRCNTVLTRSL